jgi:HEPN domain-containing protein
MAKQMNDAEYCSEWFNFAARDLSSAKFLLGHRPLPLEIICFLCQQTAEKCLKGLLVINKIRPPKIHDLLELCQICETFSPTIKEILVRCSTLNRYSVQPRYPHELPLAEDDAKEALKFAEFIFVFTKTLLPDSKN